ncbi:hypothetical protein E4U41_005544 [Claviceps citrina]|nr:hypothetical protein E4U41_005544 [Claviceps citrina]
MNKIRAIQDLNKKEIENGITPEASWHVDYRDTAFVYFGGLPYELTEGDVITIFSQFGEPTFLKLARDKETGKSKGFGWLQYEDQRSTDLAVDNLGGADVGGRIISVDHARYKPRDDEDPAEFDVSWEAMMRKEGGTRPDEEANDSDRGGESPRPMLPEERELAVLIRDHDEDDPMKAFLVEEKRKEVEEARSRHAERKEKKHSHGRGRRSHRRRDESSDEKDRRRRHRDRERDRDRSKDVYRDHNDDIGMRRRRKRRIESVKGAKDGDMMGTGFEIEIETVAMAVMIMVMGEDTNVRDPSSHGQSGRREMADVEVQVQVEVDPQDDIAETSYFNIHLLIYTYAATSGKFLGVNCGGMRD